MYGKVAFHGPVGRGFRMDPSVTKQKIKPGTVRRIAGYAKPYRGLLVVFLLGTALDSLITVVNPLLLREVIDQGILARNQTIVIVIALAVAGVALFDVLLGFINRNYERDEHGQWYFQNGPQRVYVELEYTPWVVRLASDEGSGA